MIARKYKIIAWCILGAMILSIVTLSCTGRSRHNRLKAANVEIARLERLNDSLWSVNEKLAGMEAIHCEVTINVKSTAVFGKSEIGAVNTEAKQIATYLRDEVLNKTNE